MLTKAGNWKLR